MWICIYVAKREYESHSWATVSEQQLSRRELSGHLIFQVEVEGRTILARRASILPHLGTTDRHREPWSSCADSENSAEGESGRAAVLGGAEGERADRTQAPERPSELSVGFGSGVRPKVRSARTLEYLRPRVSVKAVVPSKLFLEG